MSRNHRKLGQRSPRRARPEVWTQEITCLDCGAKFMHLEMGDGGPGDNPYGLPVGAECFDCGGEVVAARRSDAVGAWTPGE